MKRKELERFLRNNECELYREGSRHSILDNPPLVK